jgi:hypothetical protein
MKFPFKVASLLLSLMLLLNAAGFAAMLGCDQRCCQATPRPVSIQGNSMSCHEGEEMAQASAAVLQFESRPVEAPPPLNFVHCDTEVASGSFLTEKTDFRCDLIASASFEQVVAEPADHGEDFALHPLSPSSSHQITAPLRN